jgi:hypothetical protein
LPPRGAAKAELAAELAKTRACAKIYANPLFRMAIPFTGVFPSA